MAILECTVEDSMTGADIARCIRSGVSGQDQTRRSRDKDMLLELLSADMPIVGVGQHRKRLRGVTGNFFVSTALEVSFE